MEIAERKKLMRIPMCGEKVVYWLETIGIQRLSDLKGADPVALVGKINEKAGRIVLAGPVARMALQNLVQAAEGL